MSKPLPQIVRVNGRPRLMVDGRPFLIFGLQWDCDSCFSAEEMTPLFSHAVHMGANTAVLPTYWREVEPEPGHYCFDVVDERIRQARAHGLRVILLWFATWKNACPFYTPDYIRNAPEKYPRAVDRHGELTVSLCPSSETTWQRDRDALVALMTHLREMDTERTVIMVQLENEPGILGSDRCYCPICTKRFKEDDWERRWGAHAAEAFSAASIAQYIDRLVAEAKAAYPLPMYINVWLAPVVGGIPGRDYPSGGAVPAMLKLFRQHLQHVDLVAPDIYSTGYRDFHRLCQTYGADGNPLYIAEHSSSPKGRAERNVFYAIGQYGAIGFDPWAIDSPFPERDAPPLVDPVGGEWGPQAYWLRDSYIAIGRAVEPIVEAQGTERLFTFVQEAAEQGTGWEASGCDVLISYHDQEGAARGMIIQQAPNEFLLIGVGFSARFRRPRPDGRPIPILSAEWGYFEGGRWVCLHPMRRERLESEGLPVTLLEPGVARVVLDI
ncbi:MAG TPA: DUF5597 domain-containing protein [Caldilineae bacterium]|nr:DUF5597 domain-containing protein [Caldilineae bacterium]